MNLDKLLKLTIKELKELSLEEFNELSKEERRILIETKEGEGDVALFQDLHILSPQDAQDLNDLTRNICPEILAERELKRIKKVKNKKRGAKNIFNKYSIDQEKNDVVQRNGNAYVNDAPSLGNILRITEYNPSFLELSTRKKQLLQEFNQKGLLTRDFTANDLMDIFEDCNEIVDIYEESDSYSAEYALQDVFKNIREIYPDILDSQCSRGVIIIGISPEFEWREGLLEKYQSIVQEYFGDNRNIRVAIVTDDCFFGSADLYVRVIEY